MSGRSAEDRDFDRASSVSSTTESMDSITRQVGVRANILANMMTNTSIWKPPYGQPKHDPILLDGLIQTNTWAFLTVRNLFPFIYWIIHSWGVYLPGKVFSLLVDKIVDMTLVFCFVVSMQWAALIWVSVLMTEEQIVFATAVLK